MVEPAARTAQLLETKSYTWAGAERDMSVTSLRAG
jgi:hypothetical protein